MGILPNKLHCGLSGVEYCKGRNEAIDECQTAVDKAVERIELIRQDYCSCEEGRQCLTCKAMEEVKEVFK